MARELDEDELMHLQLVSGLTWPGVIRSGTAEYVDDLMNTDIWPAGMRPPGYGQ